MCFSLANKLLLHHEEKKDAEADSLTEGFKLDLAPLLTSDVVLVKLDLRDAAGAVLSQNLYWVGAESSAYRALDGCRPLSCRQSQPPQNPVIRFGSAYTCKTPERPWRWRINSRF